MAMPQVVRRKRRECDGRSYDGMICLNPPVSFCDRLSQNF